MKVVFVSNYYNHHQAPFSKAISSQPEVEYHFIETGVMSEERRKLGYGLSEYPSFVIRKEQFEADKASVQELIDKADLAIVGSASDDFIISRLKANKITFKYSERLYRNGLKIKTVPRAAMGAWRHHGRFQKYPLYMLCASAFTAADCAKFGNYINRTYRWGYFPAINQLNEEELFNKKHTGKKASILWAGRLIRWKHPDASILIADKLKKQGYSFDLNIIGNGELESELKSLIEELNLNDCVHMLGSMKPEMVQMYMAESDIFLFTSDFNEGWGAVLNESMGNGCAVVASHAIGSVPFLVKNNDNGLVYHSENNGELFQCVKLLIDDPNYRLSIAKNAYHTIHDLWSADIAAKRLLELYAKLLNDHGNTCILYSDGPCSPAPIIENNWFE